jgi:hypothetical protein
MANVNVSITPITHLGRYTAFSFQLALAVAKPIPSWLVGVKLAWRLVAIIALAVRPIVVGEIVSVPMSPITMKITMIVALVAVITAMLSPAIRIAVEVLVVVAARVVIVTVIGPAVIAEITMSAMIPMIPTILMIPMMPIAGCGNRRKQQESYQWKSSQNSQRS